MTIQKTRSLVDVERELKAADDAYYNQDDPIMSDAQYDELAHCYHQLTGKKWMKVGQPSEKLTRIPHITPMLSLEKVTSIEELVRWIPESYLSTLITPKVDGCSCELRYENGVLKMAVSRGDGEVGESVLHSLHESINLGQIPARIPGFYGQVRGEVYVPTAVWEQHFKPTGAKNPRNTAAGLLRKQTSVPEQRHLRFVAYDVRNACTMANHYHERLAELEKYGFETPPFTSAFANEFNQYTPEALHPDAWVEGELPYEIDGIVLAANELAARVHLGETSSFPRWACAFKFATEEAETTYLATEWNASRTGPVVPTHIFKAVQLCGTTVSRATGHNLNEYTKLGAAPGSKVIVLKRGEIIPRVDRLTPGQTPADVRLHIPRECPTCASTLLVKSVHLICPNPTCDEKLIGQLDNAGKRSNLDINTLSEETAAAIVKAGLTNLAELWKLTLRDLTNMPFGKSSFGATRAKKLYDAIQTAKEKPWSVVLHSLGVPGLGHPECDAIASKYSLEQLGMLNPGALKMELMNMPGIGEKTAVTFVEWLRVNTWVWDLIGVLTTEPEVVDTRTQTLLGYTVVITGKLKGSRDEYKKQLKARGAKPSESVSKDTTLLVMNPGGEGSSKHKDAVKHGVRVITEDELIQLLEGGTHA